MTNLIVEISKYLMILLMAVYTYANFRVFSPKDEKKTGWGCRAQCGAMFAIHFLAYLVMYLSREDPAVRSALAAFYCAQAVFFLCYICFSRLIYRNISRLLVNNSCMLLCTGLIMLNAAVCYCCGSRGCVLAGSMAHGALLAALPFCMGVCRHWARGPGSGFSGGK